MIELDINLTNNCILNCLFCSLVKSKTKELSTEEWLNIIKEFRELDTIKLVAFEGGEPFLRKDLSILVEETLNYAKKVKVITSGAIRCDDFISKTKDIERLRVEISIDGRKEINNLLRDNSFDRAISTLEKFLCTKNEVAIRSVISNLNIAEYQFFLDEIDDLAIKYDKDIEIVLDVLIIPHYLLTRYTKKQKLNLYDTRKIIPSIEEIVKLHKDIKKKDLKRVVYSQKEIFRSCGFSERVFISISAEGYYSYCCESEVSMGNIIVDGVRKSYKNILSYHKSSMCNTCKYKEEYCGGCGAQKRCGWVEYYQVGDCKNFIERIIELSKD